MLLLFLIKLSHLKNKAKDLLVLKIIVMFIFSSGTSFFSDKLCPKVKFSLSLYIFQGTTSRYFKVQGIK